MKYKDLSSGAIRIQNNLGAVYQGAKYRTDRKTAKQILLYGNYFYNGRFCNPVAKSVGCGVYDVWLE